MKNFKLYILFFALTVLASCQKIIEPKNLPQQDPRIVLNSVIYTDSFITANVSVSKSILSSKDYKFIDNAVCELYENDAFLQNLVANQNGNYTSSVLGKSNKKYTMKVSATGYNAINASTSLPGNVALTSVQRYDTASSDFGFYDDGSGVSSGLGGTQKYKFNIIDVPNVKNYYSIQPIIYLFDSLGNPIHFSPSFISISNNINANGGFLGEDDNGDSKTIDLDDLTLVNGKEVQVDIAINAYIQVQNIYAVKTIKVFLEIYNLSDDYYKYKKTLNDQSSTGASLFAEPVMVYSNVSNGMGILAGANLNTVPVFSGPPVKHQ